MLSSLRRNVSYPVFETVAANTAIDTSKLSLFDLWPDRTKKAENASALGHVVPQICGVPSDQLRVGTMNTSIGSGAPWNSGMR